MKQKPWGINYLSQILALFFLCFCFSMGQLRAQAPKPDQPDPVKFTNKFEIVLNVVRAVLVEMGYTIELEDPKAGRFVTKPYEFITGSLTASEIDKFAVKRDILTGSWLRAHFVVEALLERVSPTQTMVTIHTKMEGLNRDIDGTEKWMPLESLGTFERRILGKISMKLLGNETVPDSRKGFWNKNPQPVTPGQTQPKQNRPPI